MLFLGHCVDSIKPKKEICHIHFKNYYYYYYYYLFLRRGGGTSPSMFHNIRSPWMFFQNSDNIIRRMWFVWLTSISYPWNVTERKRNVIGRVTSKLFR